MIKLFLCVASILTTPPHAVTPSAVTPSESSVDRAATSAGTAAAPVETKPTQQPSETEFVRLLRDQNQQPIALQTAITQYVSRQPGQPKIAVDLIAAIHVGDRQYYEQLNKLFTSYDVVLFELIAPRGTKIKPGQRTTSSHPISLMQRALRDVLELEFQLERIDYSQQNMLHADMTPSQFRQSMQDRGESFAQMFWRILKQSMASQRSASSAPATDAQLLFALFRSDRSMRLKRIMAEQFEELEEQLASLQGPEGSTIITQRNKVALDILKQQIKADKQRLAIFYGAGHLSDMESRLIKDFQLKRHCQKWLDAWSLVQDSNDVSATDEAAQISN